MSRSSSISVASRAIASALSLLLVAAVASAADLTDITKAKAKASDSGKPILIDFSAPT